MTVGSKGRRRRFIVGCNHCLFLTKGEEKTFMVEALNAEKPAGVTPAVLFVPNIDFFFGVSIFTVIIGRPNDGHQQRYTHDNNNNKNSHATDV